MESLIAKVMEVPSPPIVVSYLTHDNNENAIPEAMSAFHVNEVPEVCGRISMAGAVV